MKFKEYLKNNKITSARIAELIDVNPSFISLVLTGRRRFSDIDVLRIVAFSNGKITEFDDQIDIFLREIESLKKKI